MSRRLYAGLAGAALAAMVVGTALAAPAGPPPGAPAPPTRAAMKAAARRKAALSRREDERMIQELLLGRGWLTPNAESQKLWKSLQDQFQKLETERWKMFGLQDAKPQDPIAIREQQAVLTALMKQMWETAHSMKPYYHAPERWQGRKGRRGAAADHKAPAATNAKPAPPN